MTKGTKIEGTARVTGEGSRQLSGMCPFETRYVEIEVEDGRYYRWTSENITKLDLLFARRKQKARQTGNQIDHLTGDPIDHTFQIRAFVRENGRDLYRVSVS